MLVLKSTEPIAGNNGCWMMMLSPEESCSVGYPDPGGIVQSLKIRNRNSLWVPSGFQFEVKILVLCCQLQEGGCPGRSAPVREVAILRTIVPSIVTEFLHGSFLLILPIIFRQLSGIKRRDVTSRVLNDVFSIVDVYPHNPFRTYSLLNWVIGTNK